MTTPAWNAMFGWPIWSDVGVSYTPVASGGSWLAALPLTNLQDRRLHRVARSADAALASTTCDIDLGVARAVRLVSLHGHNLSSAAKVRVRGWTSAPIMEWTTVGDGSWTNSGTPTRSAAATTANGIPLDLIGDDDGAGTEYTSRAVGFTGDGQKVLDVLVKRYEASNYSRVYLYDATAAAAVLDVKVDFTATTPVVTVNTGTAISTVAEGTGWRITALTAAVTATNTNNLRVYPAYTASLTQAIYIGDIHAWNADVAQVQHDSGWFTPWPSGLTAEDLDGLYWGAFDVLTADATARYWRIGIDDATNAAGYVDVGRLVVAPVWQPTINLSYGAAQGFEDDSTRTPTDGGAFIYAARARRRTLNATLADLPQDEALANLWEMQRQLGTTGQFLFVFDPTDTTHLWRRSFLATFRDLSPMEMASFGRYSTPIALVEDL